ncbi:LytR/AlgR family response regulator transcription factor [Bacteroides reticulotermitis]|uniref:Two-component system response regulator n=2 Tax=Bacteroides reticulotermitis TaxID=1133319 RepID=W4UZ80_9BACE|nr:LytTR family DNA-binding domain-containing protein [Bacteroides reticulotermitis]MBB4045968.1 DNA-binding LytR/AlgR family response regulator [Bacteroides reticulotermitis]GAE85878.1 two-component system response regulator [Bacteroides reticulotermitis JCM 10512]
MNCIIVDDEPLGREAIRLLVEDTPALDLSGSFGDAESAGNFLLDHPVDLVFLDIRMPGTDGITFARTVRDNTLVIFTTAYPEYAVDSYELDAVDYLLKPIEPQRFQKAVSKAGDYLQLLQDKSQKSSVETITQEHIFVKSDRRYFKILFRDILFIEGLKDYVVIQTGKRKIITNTTLKAIQEQLPQEIFLRTNKSYIVNLEKIDSFDVNDIYIGTHELAIGSRYRDSFMEKFVKGKLV